MANFSRGDTPTLIIHVKESQLQLEDVVDVHVTLRARNFKLTKSGKDITVNPSENTLRVKLSEKETLKLQAGTVKEQERYTLKNGNVVSSNIKILKVEDILYELEVGAEIGKEENENDRIGH